MQERHYSIANALELPLSCPNPLKFSAVVTEIQTSSFKKMHLKMSSILPELHVLLVQQMT